MSAIRSVVCQVGLALFVSKSHVDSTAVCLTDKISHFWSDSSVTTALIFVITLTKFELCLVVCSYVVLLFEVIRPLTTKTVSFLCVFFASDGNLITYELDIDIYLLCLVFCSVPKIRYHLYGFSYFEVEHCVY